MRALLFAAAGLTLLAACAREQAPPAPAGGPAKPAAAAPAAKPAALAYDAKGRRDPFVALVRPKVTEDGKKPCVGLECPRVEDLRLVGIIWQDRAYYALVELPNGQGYVIRVNSRVGRDADAARVTKITKDAVIFEIKPEAQATRPQVRTVELRLRKEE